MNKQLLIRNCMLATFFNDGYNATKILEHIDILIENGKILRIDRGIDEPTGSCNGCIRKTGGSRFYERLASRNSVAGFEEYCGGY